MIPKERLTKTIEIPEGVSVEVTGGIVKVKGPQGEIEKNLIFPTINIKTENGKIVIEPLKFTKREKAVINTFAAHLKNMLKGSTEKFVYKLKICSSHFPMNVSKEGDYIIIKNFFGEKVPRKAKILTGVDVKITGNDITVESCDKEAAGQTAANIEQACRITNRDRRIFQDGIWITSKAGKEL